MTGIFHVYSYLVGAPGFQYALYKGYITKPFQHFIMGNGFFAMIPFGVSFKQFPEPLMTPA